MKSVVMAFVGLRTSVAAMGQNAAITNAAMTTVALSEQSVVTVNNVFHQTNVVTTGQYPADPPAAMTLVAQAVKYVVMIVNVGS